MVTMTETSLETLDFDKKTNVTCPAGSYTEICTKEVKSGHIIDMGFGNKLQGVDDRGVFTATLKNSAGNLVHGKLRIKARDKGDDISSKGMAPRTQRLASGVPLGIKEAGVGATRERLLVLEFSPDVDCDVDWGISKSEVSLPITDWTSPSYR
jgi:hypothetical protein